MVTGILHREIITVRVIRETGLPAEEISVRAETETVLLRVRTRAIRVAVPDRADLTRAETDPSREVVPDRAVLVRRVEEAQQHLLPCPLKQEEETVIMKRKESARTAEICALMRKREGEIVTVRQDVS